MSATCIEVAPLPPDELAGLVKPEVQKLAARMAQDAFTALFRLSVEGDDKDIGGAVTEFGRRADNWVRAAGSDDAQALRLALLVSGIDQWGLAWCQSFGLQAIPPVSQLMDALRNKLDAGADARFQEQFAAIERSEGNAVDFKMELRRNIHLGLWHAMIACDRIEDARAILIQLGAMLVALTGRMPVIGWRLAADALAHVQLLCLSETAGATELARQATGELFDALRQSLPREIYEPMMAQANRAVVDWQRSRRMH